MKLFVKVEGNELTATTRMLNAYTRNAPALGVIGQLAAGGYTRIIDEAKYGGPHNEMVDKEPVSLREKSTAYFNITNSSYFSEVLEKIHQSPELKEQLKGIIDINYLESKEFAPPRGSTKENPLPDKLALYTFKNENINNASKNPELYQVTKNIKGKEVSNNPALVGGSLTAVQRDFREPSPHKDSTWSTAADLKADNRLTERGQSDDFALISTNKLTSQSHSSIDELVPFFFIYVTYCSNNIAFSLKLAAPKITPFYIKKTFESSRVEIIFIICIISLGDTFGSLLTTI
ncbi:hypothetical protein [Shewanella sp. VB17]|uniref:hypothetical protein n=1 Tax=Shewanella sp. VB17 TaxID=2739432 RepID=UPI001C272033|nr:hypothetical protein [Shewanella sp. VB17]